MRSLIADKKTNLIPPYYGWIIFVSIFVCYAIVLLTAKNPPAFPDYPDWVYQGVLFRHLLGHNPVHGYLFKSYPVPNALTTLGIGLLNCVVSWRWAGKLWICLYFIFAIFSTIRLSRILQIKTNSLWMILPGTVFLNLGFWAGSANFEIGVCALLLFASMLFEAKIYRTGYAWMLMLLFFIHMEICACGVLLFLCFCLERKNKKLFFQVIPTFLLTVWYIFGRFRGGNADAGPPMATQYPYGSLQFIVFKIGSYFKMLGYVNVLAADGSSRTAQMLGKNLMLLLAASSLLIGVILLILFFRYASNNVRSASDVRFAWVFVLALFLIAAILPQSMLGTSDPGCRLMLVAIAVALFLISRDKSKVMGGVAIFSLALCIANFWQLCEVSQNPHAITYGRHDGLSPMFRKYAHVDTEMKLDYYRKLEIGEWDQAIYPTALFYQKTGHP